MMLQIIQPDGTHYEQTVTSLIIPLLDGSAGIMNNHCPMLARLKDGKIVGKEGTRTFEYEVRNAFIQVLNNNITILADQVF
jgi:F-type H+-transporting ATPase subunit epsilon